MGRRLALFHLAVGLAVLGAVVPAPASAADGGGGPSPLPPELGFGPGLRWEDIAREAGPKIEGSPLSLAEAVKIAVASSPDVRVAGYDPKIALAELEARLGVYEPHLFANGSASQSVTPAGSALAGATTLDVRTYLFGGGVSQRIPTGGDLTLELSNVVTETSSTFAALNPQYTPDLAFSITQPLLKNLFTDETRSRIRSGQADLQVAATNLRARIRDTVLDLEEKYWDLAFAAEDLRVKDVALGLGERLLGNNRLRFEIGVIPETEVIAAQAEVARRRDALLVARLAYRNAQDAFRRSAGLDAAGPDVIPSDPLVTPSLDGPLEDWLDEAARKREEKLAAAAALHGLEEETRLARNSLLPQLDLVGAAGLNGTAGSAHPIVFGGETRRSPFGGSFADSYGELFGGDFYSWSAGLTLDIPVFWREAAASYRKAEATEKRSRDDLARLEKDIGLEVRMAYNGADSGQARLGTTGEVLTLAERDLAAEVTRYNVGVSQTDDVIRKLSSYALALTESIRAKTEYLKTLAILDRASGLTIERKGIPLTEPSPTR